MDAYLPRFEQMLRNLRQQAQLQLLHFSHYRGLSLAEIESLEARYLSAPLPPAARRFYQETNGLQLQWIFEKNPAFDPNRHRYHDAPLDWDYARLDYRPEDGLILIWPLEKVLQTDWSAELYFESMQKRQVSFVGKTYNAYDFHRQIKPFDLFSKDFHLAFWLGDTELPLLLGSSEQGSYLNSRRTSFASYLEFLLATYGICAWRQRIYSVYRDQQQPLIETPAAYWRATTRGPQLAQMALSARFPLADQPGAAMNKIDREGMRKRALQSKPLSIAELQHCQAQHEAFLNSGGAGGRWQTVLLRGQVVGIYLEKESKKGRQATLEQRFFPEELDFVGLRLPYANLSGIYALRQDFSEANFSHSLITDGSLEQCIFAEAQLEKADFSRCKLRGASFMNANLRGADFENADLRDTDFRGADLAGARFPGALLRGARC